MNVWGVLKDATPKEIQELLNPYKILLREHTRSEGEVFGLGGDTYVVAAGNGAKLVGRAQAQDIFRGFLPDLRQAAARLNTPAFRLVKYNAWIGGDKQDALQIVIILAAQSPNPMRPRTTPRVSLIVQWDGEADHLAQYKDAFAEAETSAYTEAALATQGLPGKLDGLENDPQLADLSQQATAQAQAAG